MEGKSEREEEKLKSVVEEKQAKGRIAENMGIDIDYLEKKV